MTQGLTHIQSRLERRTFASHIRPPVIFDGLGMHGVSGGGMSARQDACQDVFKKLDLDRGAHDRISGFRGPVGLTAPLWFRTYRKQVNADPTGRTP